MEPHSIYGAKSHRKIVRKNLKLVYIFAKGKLNILFFYYFSVYNISNEISVSEIMFLKNIAIIEPMAILGMFSNKKNGIQ